MQFVTLTLNGKEKREMGGHRRAGRRGRASGERSRGGRGDQAKEMHNLRR